MAKAAHGDALSASEADKARLAEQLAALQVRGGVGALPQVSNAPPLTPPPDPSSAPLPPAHLAGLLHTLTL